MPSTGLDTILYDDFAKLRKIRVLEDEQIENFISNLNQDFLTGTITYVNNQHKVYTDPVDLLLSLNL